MTPALRSFLPGRKQDMLAQRAKAVKLAGADYLRGQKISLRYILTDAD
jgi:hypothetical protein